MSRSKHVLGNDWSSHLAGTSLDLPEHYLSLVAAYQERFAAFQQEKTGGRSGGGIRLIVKMGNEEAAATEADKSKSDPVREITDLALTH